MDTYFRENGWETDSDHGQGGRMVPLCLKKRVTAMGRFQPQRWFDHIITGMHAMGTALVFILMTVIVLDVLGRAFLNHPLTGGPELAKVTLVALLFLGLSKTQQQNRHIRATFLLGRVSFRTRACLNILAGWLGIVVFSLLCVSGWDLMIESWRIWEYEGAGALRVPIYPLRTLIVLCGALMVIQLLRQMIGDFRRLFGPRGG
jgi:TRAP-type C4-dicarboxylate transport system permease small subunit